MKTIALIIAATILAAGSSFAFTDKDYTGLSDVYEFIYLNGPADAYADADGDGVSNYDEMVWGTNPTNTASRVTGPTVTLTNKVLRFTWPAAAYRLYELRASEDMVIWRTILSGTNTTYTENLSAANAPARRYYRLSVRLQPNGPFPTDLLATSAGPDLVLTWSAALNQIYGLQGSANLGNWQTLAASVVSPYLIHPHGAGMPAYNFYRLAISGGLAPAADGLDAWEEALYVQTFGVLPATRDSDGDGLNDAVEFQQGHLAGKKDHPAVGLVVFTPLEK